MPGGASAWGFGGGAATAAMGASPFAFNALPTVMNPALLSGAQYAAGTPAALTAGGAGSMGGLAGLGVMGKSFLGLGAKSIAAFGGGAAGTAGAMATSPAAGLLGGILAFQGLKKGGVKGLGMTVAGGALVGASIGFMVGGPIGAAIGAGIGAAAGAVAGVVRLFIKDAHEKVREKVKALYGVDIKDKKIRQLIVDIAKQKYGGNLDMAVRSLEVQELVKLYALTQGEQAQGMPRPMYGATLAQGGGALNLQPVYSNGQLVANPYSGTTTTQWANQGIYVQLNPQQANDLFEGKVVNVLQNNPASVAEANASGAKSGTARDSQRTALMEPLTVTR